MSTTDRKPAIGAALPASDRPTTLSSNAHKPAGRVRSRVVRLIVLGSVAALMAALYVSQRQSAADLAEYCASPASDAFQFKLACLTYGR